MREVVALLGGQRCAKAAVAYIAVILVLSAMAVGGLDDAYTWLWTLTLPVSPYLLLMGVYALLVPIQMVRSEVTGTSYSGWSEPDPMPLHWEVSFAIHDAVLMSALWVLIAVANVALVRGDRCGAPGVVPGVPPVLPAAVQSVLTHCRWWRQRGTGHGNVPVSGSRAVTQ